VLIMTDLRNNMHFATRGCFKSVNGARAAGLLAWAAHHRGDRLGGIVFGDTRHRELRPRLGRQAALRYVHELVTHPDWTTDVDHGAPEEEPPLTQAMAMLRRVAHPGSLVIIVSDFVGLSHSAMSYLTGIARHNEVLAVFLSDPLERQLPPPGRYRIVSHDEEMAIDTFAKGARTDYRQAFEERLHDFDIFCHRYGIHLLPLSTDDDPVETLQQALGKRVL
jgi:uncharacterized protein (DUF58 family)